VTAGPANDAPRVALVHDWLTGMRGGEKVLDALCEMFPSAPLYTLVRVPGSVSPRIEARPIHTSFVQRLPRPGRFYRHYLPLYPLAVELFDFSGYDLVISSSHCAVKSVKVPASSVHLCYCHSPMRYAWDQFDAYFGPAQVGELPSRLMRPVMRLMARWDRATAGRVDHFLANSRYVAARIARYYNRQASVLYPPVDTSFFTPGGAAPEPYYLVVSALVPYKRIDIAIQAASRLGVPLKIAGAGPDGARLRALGGSTVEFLGAVDDQSLRDLYRRAQALVLPAEEDFGIAPVESMACGRPVVAFARGGVTESVEAGVTGLLVEQQTPEAFAEAMEAAAARPWVSARLVERAAAFAPDRFARGFQQAVSDMLSSARPC